MASTTQGGARITEPQAVEVAGFPGIHARPEGEARPHPLVMLHGVLFDHRDFGSYCRFFSARGYECWAFSRRGRAGVPPPGAKGVRISDYVEDTLAIVTALDRRPIIIGHSLGALVAQKVAEADRCRALVLLGPTPPRWVAPRPPASALTFYLGAVPAILSGRPHRPRPDVVTKVALRVMPQDQRRELLGRMVPESGLVLRELALGTPVDREKVRCPVLALGGEADGVYPPRVVRTIARHYGGTYLSYPGHDHWLMDEPGWEGPASDIADWLAKLDEER